jgi:hypothetical protein
MAAANIVVHFLTASAETGQYYRTTRFDLPTSQGY